MEDAIRKAAVLIEALPYIRAFRNAVVIVKFGGSIMEEETVFNSILTDIVFMETVGMKPVLVHGGGPEISQEMKKRGKTPEFVRGHRVTDAETLEIVKDVLGGRIAPRIAERINQLGGKAKCLWDVDRPALFGKKRLARIENEAGETEEIDLGRVGDVTRVETSAIDTACAANYVPVIPPLACADDGEFLNVNADVAAAVVASSMKAEKVVLLSDTNGIMTVPDDPNSLVPTLHESEIQDLIARGVIRGGMLPKVEACLRAVQAGVRKAHIIDGRIEHSILLEIFTSEGIGTQIVH